MNEIQKKCVVLLKEFIQVAKTHNLSWFIDGGTLLGTIRDGKFIEWDDDIDIVMPRQDYNKFIKLQFKSPFFLQTPLTDSVNEVSAKLRLDSTTAITKNEFSQTCHKGIFIDIFPIDTLPSDWTDESLLCIKGYIKTVMKYTTYSVKRKFKQINTFVSSLQNTDSSKYCANIMYYRYQEKPTVLYKSDYENCLEMLFEDVLVNVPIGFKRILETWYGKTYMQPKQLLSGHGNTFYNANKDYSEYSDIYTFNDLFKEKLNEDKNL